MADEKKPSAAPEGAKDAKDKGAKGAKAAGKTGKAAAKSRKKKVVKNVPVGRAYVQATYNNTIVTLTDANGNVLGWSSAGHCGFKGAKKATPYAASMIVKDVVEKTAEYGLKEVAAFVCGVGSGREGAIRALHANGLHVTNIKETTPIPHNGCRAPKPRRV